ncbi:MAG: hypothetical protein FWG97_02500 [Deltaproteobacteria bacterium]|nr:hypothetical protein [Deltaproteobacteria bacterium]
MTSEYDDQPAPDPGDKLKEGIYLEKKKSSIGTGGTAKAVEYRNFWATGSLEADSAVMVLLDDNFNPTSLRETFSLKTLAGPDWFFISEGEKKYQRLRSRLDQILKPPETKAETPAAAPSKVKWWEGSAPSGPPANPFELKKPPKIPKKKGGWWET